MRPSYRRGNLNRMGGLLNNSLEEMGLRHRIMEFQVMGKWKQVVGPHIAAATVAENVRDGVLFVCCKSSMWANECTFHKERIIKDLNRSVGKKVITDIRFGSRGYRKAVEEQKPEKKSNIDKIKIDDSQSQIAAKVAETSSSTELAAKIRNAILTSKRLEKAKLDEGWKKCPKCSNLHNGESDLCNNCR